MMLLLGPLNSSITSPIESETGYSIASVFCDPAERGKGYAQLMMRWLHDKLSIASPELPDTAMPEEYGRQDGFLSFLFSDIGEFYAPLGWQTTEPYDVTWNLSDLRDWVGAVPDERATTIDLDQTKAIANMDTLQTIQELTPGTFAVRLTGDEMAWFAIRSEFAGRCFGKQPSVWGSCLGCVLTQASDANSNQSS